MNNEPVAWMEYIQDEEWEVWFVEPTDLPKGHTYKPLYTHPAKYCPSENNAAYEKGFIDGMAKMTESAVHRAVEGMSEKTLTDEEIQEIAHGFGAIGWMGETTYEFARAILRKAQEK
jgi:hypothetical protein